MKHEYTTPTEYRKLLTMYGFSVVGVVRHTAEGKIEIKVQQVSKQSLIKISKRINSVKPEAIRVIIKETNPEGGPFEHTYDTTAVTAENGIGRENTDTKPRSSQPHNAELLTETEKNDKTTYTEKTLSDVKQKYVNGEITILELEKQLEEVLDPEPIAVD